MRGCDCRFPAEFHRESNVPDLYSRHYTEIFRGVKASCFLIYRLTGWG